MNIGIYCIENLIDGKKYVGQSQNLKRRMKATHKENIYLFRAIQKYGRDNFKTYVVEYCDIDDLDEREIYYIKEFHSHYTEGGYNISWGGDAPMRGRKHTEETKKMYSETRKERIYPKGKDSPSFGRHHTEESKEKMRKNRPDTSGENHWAWGKHYSKETREKMRNNSPTLYTKKDTAASKFYGLTARFYKKTTYWVARIYAFGKRIYLGQFGEEKDAARAYDKFVIENNLPHPLNFPEEYNRKQ